MYEYTNGIESLLRRADHSSRGVLQTVLRRFVWSRNLMHEGAIVGPQRQMKIKKRTMFIQGGSNMTGTDLCVNKCKQSRSYLNHSVFSFSTEKRRFSSPMCLHRHWWPPNLLQDGQSAGIKRSWLVADHSPRSKAKFNNERRYKHNPT